MAGQSGTRVSQREETSESIVLQRKLSIAEREAEVTSNWSDEPYGVEERDFKKKQVCGLWFHV